MQNPAEGKRTRLEVVILMGLQGSGKSTFFRQQFAGSHTHISMDLFRNNRRPQLRQLTLLDETLARGEHVVVDNTNPAVIDRVPLLDMAKSYGAKVIGYYFRSVVTECRDRNNSRSGKARVPDVALYATVKKLQLPSPDEAFDELYYVRQDGAGGFVVEPYMEVDDKSQTSAPPEPEE